MLVHVVLFWLKEECTEADHAEFRKYLDTLKEIDLMEACYTGTPADVPSRPMIDTSYDFALTCIFKSIEDHNTYQQHPIHSVFLEHCEDKWDKVLVYDPM